MLNFRLNVTAFVRVIYIHIQLSAKVIQLSDIYIYTVECKSLHTLEQKK